MSENKHASELEAAIDLSRKWLLQNGDYNIRIDISGLYGAYSVVALYRGEVIKSGLGNNLIKHINICIAAAIAHKAEHESN